VATAFTSRVLSIVRRIPPGCVATYGDVAALAGRPRAARAVGTIMKGCSQAGVPAHRVIGAGGRLGGYGGQEAMKRALLVAEGVVVTHSRIRLQQFRWNGGPGGIARAGDAGRTGTAGRARQVRIRVP
jgi:O-6-methylguanine DNA methyltransferase